MGHYTKRERGFGFFCIGILCLIAAGMNYPAEEWQLPIIWGVVLMLIGGYCIKTTQPPPSIPRSVLKSMEQMEPESNILNTPTPPVQRTRTPITVLPTVSQTNTNNNGPNLFTTTTPKSNMDFVTMNPTLPQTNMETTQNPQLHDFSQHPLFVQLKQLETQGKKIPGATFQMTDEATHFEGFICIKCGTGFPNQKPEFCPTCGANLM